MDKATSLLFSLALGLAWIALVAGNAAPPRGNSVLVVGESDDVKTTHSRLISTLEDAGRDVDFISASGSGKSISLYSEGEYKYDGVMLLAPYTTTLSSKLSLSKILSFVDSGRDVFVVSGSSGYSTHVGKIAEAFGVDLDDKDNSMVDYQRTLDVQTANDSSSGWIRPGGWSRHVFGADPEDPDRVIGFSGPGATLFKDNELVTPFAWGAGSSFGRRKRAAGARTAVMAKVPRVAGAGAVLGAAIGTRTGGRAAWFGSFEALGDGAFDALGSAHEAAMLRMVLWAMGEFGVLRIADVRHGRVVDGGVPDSAEEEFESPSEYRVKDKFELAVHLQAWDGISGKWVTYECDDMQVEFVMMNPWVRTRLTLSDPQESTYKALIQVPDQIGVYKIKIEYVRRGVSPIFYEQVIPVRPFLHNEYERFIAMASPYYAASFSMIVGVFLVGLVVLYGGDSDLDEANGTREKTE